MPLVVAAGVTAAGAIWGASETAKSNNQAAQAGSKAAVDAAQIQADAAQKAANTASDANRASADAILKAAEDALDFQKAAYAQKQAQTAPYIGMGQGALSALGAGLGVKSVPQPPPVMPAPTRPAGMEFGISPPTPPTPAPGASSAAQATTGPSAAPQTPPLSTLANLGMPQTQAPNQSASSLQAAQVGEQRNINGVPAVWTGQGWRAAQSASSVGAGA